MSVNYRLLNAVAVLCCFVVFSAPIFAKQTYHIPRIVDKPTIDGQLNAKEWQHASQVELAYNVDPGNSTPAPIKTTAYMMENGDYLFFAFKAYDPDPNKILAYIRDRDGIFQDDFVGVILDTFNDERKGYEFFVNPMGSQGGLTRDDTLGNEDSSWDTVWDSAAEVTKDGYIVEMAIPFRALRFPTGKAKQFWGIQFLRIYPRDSRMLLTDNPQQREIDCSICQYNKVEGMPNLELSNSNFDLTPTLTMIDAEQNNSSEVGVDFRWAMSEDWVMNATVNPDFSQVEADAGQLDINNTFSLFYPEARAFFLDGADYFQSMNRLVHTRNIADPEYGIKITGKSNGYALGVIASSDENTSFLLPSSLGSRVFNLEGEKSDALVVRGQMDIGDKNNLGVLLTQRSATNYKNQVAAIDGKYYFTKNDVLSYQLMASDSDNPEQTGLAANQSDQAMTLGYRHKEENYNLRANYNDFGEDFRADMGFIGQVDYKKLIVGGDYFWFGGKDSKWTRWGFFGDVDRTDDQSGKMLEKESEIHFNIRGPLQFESNMGVVSRDSYVEDYYANDGFGLSSVDGYYLEQDLFMMFFRFKPISDITIGNFLQAGDQIDYSHAELGEGIFVEPFIDWQVGKHLTINLRHTNQKLKVNKKQDYVETSVDNFVLQNFAAGQLFQAKLFDLRATYQFNVRSRLSLTLQKVDINRNTALYIDNADFDQVNDQDSRYQGFGTQLIYSYKINPQSLVYLGYSDNAVDSQNLTKTSSFDKTLFAKFSYLWQN
jgi:hypothetical protein